jgi:hypothetical protein
MANFVNIVDLCRDAVPAGAARFIHGRLQDFTNDYSGSYPLVTLLPFTIQDHRGTPDAVFDFATIVVGFWQEDRPDTTPSEREGLIDQMDILSDQFLDSLQDERGVRLTGIQKEPQYQMFQGTLSGMAVQFRIDLVAPC